MQRHGRDAVARLDVVDPRDAVAPRGHEQPRETAEPDVEDLTVLLAAKRIAQATLAVPDQRIAGSLIGRRCTGLLRLNGSMTRGRERPILGI